MTRAQIAIAGVLWQVSDWRSEGAGNVHNPQGEEGRDHVSLGAGNLDVLHHEEGKDDNGQIGEDVESADCNLHGILVNARCGPKSSVWSKSPRSGQTTLKSEGEDCSHSP